MNKKTFSILTLPLFAVKSNAQPPAGAVAAKQNIQHYAGVSYNCYDINNNLSLSVNAIEVGWSAALAKTAWIEVTPSNFDLYAF